VIKIWNRFETIKKISIRFTKNHSCTNLKTIIMPFDLWVSIRLSHHIFNSAAINRILCPQSSCDLSLRSMQSTRFRFFENSKQLKISQFIEDNFFAKFVSDTSRHYTYYQTLNFSFVCLVRSGPNTKSS